MPDPNETFLYFAHGSNLLSRRLTAGTPSAPSSSVVNDVSPFG